MKYSSKTPMLGNRKQKVGKVIKSLLQEREKVGKYTQHFVKLDGNQIHELLQKCAQGNTEGGFTIEFDFNIKQEYIFPFILFLTNRQIDHYEYNKDLKINFHLVMSNTQFHKTCFATILLNRDIYYYSKYEVLPPPPKIKRNAPLLAIFHIITLIKMTTYIEYGVTLTPNQKSKLISAIKNKSQPTLRLKHSHLRGSDELMLTRREITKIEKSLTNGTGSDIKISRIQIRRSVKHGGNLFTSLASLGAPLLP